MSEVAGPGAAENNNPPTEVGIDTKTDAAINKKAGKSMASFLKEKGRSARDTLILLAKTKKKNIAMGVVGAAMQLQDAGNVINNVVNPPDEASRTGDVAQYVDSQSRPKVSDTRTQQGVISGGNKPPEITMTMPQSMVKKTI